MLKELGLSDKINHRESNIDIAKAGYGDAVHEAKCYNSSQTNLGLVINPLAIRSAKNNRCNTESHEHHHSEVTSCAYSAKKWLEFTRARVVKKGSTATAIKKRSEALKVKVIGRSRKHTSQDNMHKYFQRCSNKRYIQTSMMLLNDLFR